MKLLAKPLLEGSSAAAFSIEENELTPRRFVDLLDEHRALLFSQANSPLSTEEFGQFVVDLGLQYYPYFGGAAPRTIIPVKAAHDIVFTANESPPDQPIPFHHELAQTAKPPEYIFFYCNTPVDEGGETPIIDSTKVYRYVKDHHSKFLQKLTELGARYLRTLGPEDDPSSPIGRSYKNTYLVDSEAELELKLSKIEGCSWEWLDDGSVRVTSEAVPAIRLVADHANNYVFNYAFSNSIVAAYLGWQDKRNNRREALRFGNMEKMPEDVLEDIAAFMTNECIRYKWQEGDIMALNNQLVMHSRNPFIGKRVVYASIWGALKPENALREPDYGVAVGHRAKGSFDPLRPSDPLIFGFWKVPQDKCADVCYQAILAGYRRLDCACDYGNEHEVGIGIARALHDGICTRDQIYVTSKLWNTYHNLDHVELALARTLSDLGLEYVDEYLIHFPISLEFVPFEAKYPPEWTNLDNKMVVIPNDICATWTGMEKLVDKGKVREIGVCNFSTQLLRQLLATCRIRPSSLQIELHPHNSQTKLVRFASEAGLRVTGFSVLGASSYIELGMASNTDLLLYDDTIIRIASSKRKTAAQVLIRWAVQRGTLPICKSSTPSRMQENRDIFDFHLSGPEMALIGTLNLNRRFNDPGAFCEAGMGTFMPIYE